MKPQLVVNGRARELGEVGGHVTLLEWLRTDGPTGCKEGCAEGECGACAVLVARPGGPDRTRWVAVNACLVPAAAFDRQEVVTAEGLGQPGRATRTAHAPHSPSAQPSLQPVRPSARSHSRSVTCPPTSPSSRIRPLTTS